MKSFHFYKFIDPLIKLSLNLRRDIFRFWINLSSFQINVENILEKNWLTFSYHNLDIINLVLWNIWAADHTYQFVMKRFFVVVFKSFKLIYPLYSIDKICACSPIIFRSQDNYTFGFWDWTTKLFNFDRNLFFYNPKIYYFKKQDPYCKMVTPSDREYLIEALRMKKSKVLSYYSSKLYV